MDREDAQEEVAGPNNAPGIAADEVLLTNILRNSALYVASSSIFTRTVNTHVGNTPQKSDPILLRKTVLDLRKTVLDLICKTSNKGDSPVSSNASSSSSCSRFSLHSLHRILSNLRSSKL